jgi:hypothetical protein
VATYVLDRSNTRIVGSNPAPDIDECPLFFRIAVGLRSADPPSKESYQNI